MMSPLDPLKNVMPNLEQAMEFRPLFLMTGFVLFTDFLSVEYYGSNILNIHKLDDFGLQKVAIPVVLSLLIFGYSTSLFLRIFKNLTDQIVGATIWQGWIHIKYRWFWVDNNNTHSGYRSVFMHDLREKAHKTKDPYYLSLLKEGEHKEREYEDSSDKLSFAAFSTVIISFLDLFCGNETSDRGIIRQALAHHGTFGYYIFGIMVLFLLVLSFRPIFIEYPRKIYCPELADEIRAKLR